MIGAILKLVFILTAGVAYSCDVAKQLPDLERRARNYKVDKNEPFVNDLLLRGDWYNVTGHKGQYKMPDSDFKPPLGGCGTISQIYINGTHPEVTSETTVDVVACVQGGLSKCYTQITISIRNCSGELQYRLPTTGLQQAFCFDPPETQQVKRISAAPTNFNPGVVTILSNLNWTASAIDGISLNIPKLYFACSFNQAADLFYKVTWYVDGLQQFHKGPIQTIETLWLTSTELVSAGFYLGIELQCGVQASNDESGLLTSSTFSKTFFAGIEILNKTVVLDSIQHNVSILFRSTIPIGCIYPKDNACQKEGLQVHMKNPRNNCYHDIAFQGCFTNLKLLTRNETTQPDDMYAFQITSNLLFLNPTNIELHLQTQADPWIEPFYANQTLPIVSVIVDNGDWSKGHCYSHIDPHMNTFDGRYYRPAESGDFVLYRNKMYDIEVQERTETCLVDDTILNGPTCACQVAVRAGGDVFVINRCSGTTMFNEFLLCNDGGLLYFEEMNGFSFKIHTPIGTVVAIENHNFSSGSFLNVDIYSSPKDLNHTEGLCGFHDGNPNNDFRMPDGSEDPLNFSADNFSNKWRVPNNKGILTGYDLSHVSNGKNMNSLVCVCKKSNEFPNDNKSRVAEASCDSLDNESCPYTVSYTNRKCIKATNVKKRSFSRHALTQELFVKTTDKKKSKGRQKRSTDSNRLTEEEIRGNCSSIIRNAPSVVQFPDRLMGEDIDEVIEQCVFDVMIADGDLSVGEVHARSLNNVVKQTFFYEPTFVTNNTDIIRSFLKETCPNNCSRRGVCSEAGECVCETLYHGPKCELYERDPIDVDLILGNGVCDSALGDDCRCHWFYTNNLLENFSCKFRQFKVGIDNAKFDMGEFVVPGEYDDMFTGLCCIPETRNKRSIQSTGLGYELELAISNDGTHFGSGQTLYVIDQNCLNVVTNTSTNERSLKLKDGYCLIDFQCVADTEMRFSDKCRVCSVHLDLYGWTFVCQETNEADNPTPKTVGIAVGTAVGGVAVLCAVIWIYRKLKSKNCPVDPVTKKTKSLYGQNSNEAYLAFPEVPCKST